MWKWGFADKYLVLNYKLVHGFGLLPNSWSTETGAILCAGILAVYFLIRIVIWAFFLYDEAPSSGQLAVQTLVGTLYFLLPFDFLPDIAPPVTYVDDASLLVLILYGFLRAAKPKRDTKRGGA